jgi:outer membrane protein assembly factor BamB
VRLCIGSSDAALVRCHAASSGEILWETNVGGRAYGRPSRFGRYLIFGLSGAAPNNAHFESGVVALDARDGRVAWKLALPRPSSEAGFAPYGVLGHTSVEGSVLCFSDESGSLYAYELRD